jgi:hypothetical protein
MMRHAKGSTRGRIRGHRSLGSEPEFQVRTTSPPPRLASEKPLPPTGIEVALGLEPQRSSTNLCYVCWRKGTRLTSLFLGVAGSAFLPRRLQLALDGWRKLESFLWRLPLSLQRTGWVTLGASVPGAAPEPQAS